MVQEKDKEEEVQWPDDIVLAELVSYIEERRASSDKEHSAIFKLSYLNQWLEESQWHMKDLVFEEGQVIGPDPTNPSSSVWTHKVNRTSGWTLLGSVSGGKSPTTKPRGVGMGYDIWQLAALLDVTKSCWELVWCGCKKGCKARCSCFKVNLTCTELSTCSNECTNTDWKWNSQ